MMKMVVVSLAFLLMVSACTKQREAQFTTGQGENLLEVSNFDGKTFEITTGAALEDQKRNFSKAQSLDVKAKQLGTETFSVVSYQVNDPLAKKLLGDTPIVGKRNTKYQGLIKVTQNFVKVFKVAKLTEIPLNEATYAEKLNNDMVAVPLIGYPITGRFTIDRIKNEVGEVSSTKYEKSQENIASATHFRMDLSRGEVFEAVVKTDVLPADYFTGEWYYNETVTSAPEEESTNLGFSTAYDSTLTPSTRVKFLSNEKSLKIVNVNIDQRLVKNQDVNYKTALTIPVQWKAFKVASNGTGMSERDDDTIHWSKRPYISLQFDEAQGAGTDPMDEIRKKSGARLVNLEISDNYFSFVLENSGYNTRTRYSFLKVKPSNYVPKRLYKEDKRTFGFFETEKAVALTYENQRLEDHEKNVLISRFNPKADIVFHFTKTSPQWIRSVVRDAIKEWDQAFTAAGAKSRIVLNEEQDVELGDLRYNAINVIENLTASNLFGFGPSVTDPFTGEIISATTNVHLTPIREAIIAEIKNYIAMKVGSLAQGKIAGISAQLLALQDMVIEEKGENLVVTSNFSKFLKNVRMPVPSAANPNKIVMRNIDFRQRTKQNAKEFDVAMASGNIHHEIEAQCSEIVDYLKEIQGQKVTHNERENSVLDSCSRKLVLGKFAGTLIHELGHNFGLRHNFMASNDTKNFWPVNVTGGKNPVRSSSVMEYSAFNEDRLVKPGTYDIAAIRFGYADAVETADGKIKSLDTRNSITQNTKETGIRRFKFCTDEDVYYSIDPMCQRHDAGETPLEVVKNIIADYQATYQLRNFRRDSFRAISPQRLAEYNLEAHFLPLVRFYQEWRQGLARFVGQDEQYLERMSKEEMAEIIRKMSQDERFKGFVAQYKPVAEHVFGFLMQIATLDNRYCVLADMSGKQVKLEELQKVRETEFFLNKKSINSCQEAQNQEVWAGTGYSLVKEIGYHLNTFRYDLSAEKSTEPFDVIGIQSDRAMAWALLTNWRLPMSFESMSRGFAPSFMDEPEYREFTKMYATNRLSVGLSGAKLANYITETDARAVKIKETLKNSFLPKFSQEKGLLQELFPLWVSGILIPGKQAESFKRMTTLSVVTTPEPTQELVAKAKAMTSIGGKYILALNEDATDAIELINIYNQISGIKTATLIDLDDAKTAALVKELQSIVPDKAELKDMTVAELSEVLAKKGATMKALSESEVGKKNQMLFANLKNLFGIFAQLEQMKEVEEAKEQVAKFFALKVSEFEKSVLQKENAIQDAGEISTLIEANNRKARIYKENRVDIDAQLDILSSTLMAL